MQKYKYNKKGFIKKVLNEVDNLHLDGDVNVFFHEDCVNIYQNGEYCCQLFYSEI